MRRIRYCVAISLDGYIAGPDGEHDWIVIDPEIDFRALAEQFDVYLIGRKTFEATGEGLGSSEGSRTFVFSRTLAQSDYDNVTVVGENWEVVVQSLRQKPGKDIWLFGGGALFGSLIEEGLVDTVEVAVIPTILGGGTPLVAEPASRIDLTLKEHRVYKQTGIVSLVYSVNRSKRG